MLFFFSLSLPPLKQTKKPSVSGALAQADEEEIFRRMKTTVYVYTIQEGGGDGKRKEEEK